MKANTTLFAILVFAAIFSITTVDFAAAQMHDAMPDGDGENKDGEHEGKSCPFKDKKTASFYVGSNL